MAVTLKKLVDPARWRHVLERTMENRRRRSLDETLDTAWAERGPVSLEDGPATVIVDAMWYNPNHFLRLRLFLESLATKQRFRILGILLSRSARRERRALERLGVREFIYLEEDEEFQTDGFLKAADALLATAQNHSDFLSLDLPHGLPAYVVYDTALRIARDPQPALDNPVWRQSLAETLRNLAIYERELTDRCVSEVALSHPWKAEWGKIVWLALEQTIPVYHLTGYVEAMRIRRFRSRADFFSPVEHLSATAFDTLPAGIREELVRIGESQLERRTAGGSNDINARHAFRPSARIDERSRAREVLAGENGRPVITVYGHVWYDFPHTFSMSNFTDFRDWMELTLRHVATLDDVTWLIKPHPTEGWYDGFRLAELMRAPPAHVRLLPPEVDNKTVLNASDCIVTVHGTVGLEAAAFGLPVLLADNSYFSDWDFAHLATDRTDYLRLLEGAKDLAAPDSAARDRAHAAFALALGEPPADSGALPMSCDSLGSVLYREVIAQARGSDEPLARERSRLRLFLDQEEVDSYAAFHLVELARSRVAARDTARRRAAVS